MTHLLPGTGEKKTSRPRWKLQTRLVVTVLGIASLIVVLIAVTSASVLSGVLASQLKDEVAKLSGRQAAEVSLAIKAGATNATDVLTYSRADSGVLLLMRVDDTYSGAYVDGSSEPVALDNDIASVALTKVAAVLATNGQPGPAGAGVADVTIPGAGVFRVTIVDVYNGRVVLGLPLSKLQQPLTQLMWAISIVTAVGLVVLALATLLVIRAGLRPLREVVTTAEHVAALKLDRGEVSITDRVDADAVDDHTEIGRVGAALNTMLDHVDDSLQARSRNEELMRRFVADASHELRTPLASIRGYSELSLRASDNPESTATALERIQAQSLRMTRLVEDLLLLARLDEGQEIIVGEVDLTPLVIDSVSDARAAGRTHTWNVDVTGDSVLVLGDAGRLNQVVTNLLANARTHTPDGTTVTLSLRTSEGDAIVTVHDDGPGIDPSVRDDLFERFARADKSRARKTGGTGLGLSIAKAIAYAHGGSLSVTSEPGDTAFTFTLPLAPATATATAPPVAPASA